MRYSPIHIKLFAFRDDQLMQEHSQLRTNVATVENHFNLAQDLTHGATRDSKQLFQNLDVVWAMN
jgi:hypothetical protein